ncbi:MAG: AI-2E family transporter [Armatimonadota bacterium]
MKSPAPDQSSAFRPWFWVILLALLVLAGFVYGPFIQAILWPAILGVLLYPTSQRIAAYFNRKQISIIAPSRDPNDKAIKWGRRPLEGIGNTLGPLFTVLGLIFVVLGPLSTAGIIAVAEARQLVAEINAEAEPRGTTLENLAHEAQKRLQPTLNTLGFKDLDLAAVIQENGTRLAQNSARPVAEFLGKLVFVIVITLMSLVALFYALRDGHKLRGPAVDLLPVRREEGNLILDRLVTTIKEVAKAIVAVAFIQGLLAGLFAGIIGIKGAVLIGLLTFVMACIPLLGPPSVYIPVVITLVLQGDTGRAIAMLIFGMAILSNIDNLLRPFFIQASMPPVGVFFALITGVLFFGPIGVMLGPMFLSVLLSVAEIMRNRRAELEDAAPAA